MSNLAISPALSSDGAMLEVAVGGRLDIETAPELRQFLLAHMPTVQKVRLDVSQLSTVDLAGMQLICSACRTALAGTISFRFSGTLGPCVQEAIGTVGLQRHTTCKHNADNPCIWCGGLN